LVGTSLVSSFSKVSWLLKEQSETTESSGSVFDMRSVASVMLVGIAYYIGTRIGFAFTPNGQPNSTFWPPNAIFLAALLLARRRKWWMLLLAVLPAHLAAQLQTGVPVWTAVGWFITNTGEALIGAYCITRFAPPRRVFDSARGVLIFLGFGVLIAPLATSFLDAAAVVLTNWGRYYWPIGAQRFWTNALAELTVVPTIVLFSSNGFSWIRKATIARWWEAGLLTAGMILITIGVFGLPSLSVATTPALLYAPLPFLLWATIRFGSAGLSLSLLCIALISIWCTMHLRQPFPYASIPQNVLSLQILFCAVAVSLLFLSALMAEAQRTQESLRRMGVSLIEAQEQERCRIARELHDDLGQELALVQVTISGLIEDSDESLKPGLTELSASLSHVATAAREISHGLYPSQLEYVGLATAIKRLCDDVRRGKHLSINVTVGILPKRVNPSVSLCLYRVAQEALHNIISHSQAGNVQVELGADNVQILLRIIDDGLGFDVGRVAPGLGLPSMRERVRSVRGSIDITSKSKLGTRVEVTVPFLEVGSPGVPRVA
jgi:signal transduction histidine kinase